MEFSWKMIERHERDVATLASLTAMLADDGEK